MERAMPVLMEKDTPVLCRSTFFMLLSQARKPRLEANERLRGKKSKLSEAELLVELIKIFYPDYIAPESNTMKVVTSDFIRGEEPINSINILFSVSSLLIDAFDKRIKSKYTASLADMQAFTNNTILKQNYLKSTSNQREI